MKKALTLSLIIPAYNEEQHLISCLDAIAAQTVMPDEVIVVDNNCTDRTVATALRYPFVRVVRETEQGIVYARNTGFNAAKMELIGRIDADSILPHDWIRDVHTFYETHNPQTDCLTGSGQFYNVPFPRVSRYVLGLLAFRVNRLVLGHHFLYGSNMVMPRLVWNKIKDDVCLRNDIHEDIDIAVHAHAVSAGIYYKPKIVVGVKLRRVFQDHGKLWANLMLWPQSLRVHGRKLWFTGFIGAVLLYSLTPLLYLLRGLQLLIRRR